MFKLHYADILKTYFQSNRDNLSLLQIKSTCPTQLSLWACLVALDLLSKFC